MSDQPIYVVIKIEPDDIYGPSQEACDQLITGSRKGDLHIDGLGFDCDVVQVSHGRYPS